MADIVTVQSLMDGARQRADMVNSQFVTDTELIGYLSHVYKRFYNKVVNTFENYYVKTTSFNTVIGQELYDLPSDFLKVLGVDVIRNNVPFTLTPWSLNERNRILNGYNDPIRYVLQGSKIRLLPAPQSVQPITLYYTPTAENLTAAIQTVEMWAGFGEYVMIAAAVLMKQKEESDASILIMMQKELETEIFETLRGRDSGFPQKVTDVERINDATLTRWGW